MITELPVGALSRDVSQSAVDAALEKAWDGRRLSTCEAVALFSAPLPLLGAVAHRIRMRLHPDGLVTFVKDRNINYTNVCTALCSFCAFYRKPGHQEGYVLPQHVIFKKIEELEALGGHQVMLQGGHNPQLKIEYYEDLFRSIMERFPRTYLHSLTPSEVDHISRVSKLSVQETLVRLRAAGLRSLPGGGAEMLVERVKQAVSPHKMSADRWFEVMETAHALGMESTATMVIGFGETHAERVEHLMKIRDLQDRTGKFRAFIPWTLAPGHELSHLPAPGGVEYLRILAISRIVLDNVPHLHSGWVTEGRKMAQVALTFGADDLGGIMMEENVVSATGIGFVLDEEQLVAIVKGLGFTPALRDTEYRVLNTYQ